MAELCSYDAIRNTNLIVHTHLSESRINHTEIKGVLSQNTYELLALIRAVLAATNEVDAKFTVLQTLVDSLKANPGVDYRTGHGEFSTILA